MAAPDQRERIVDVAFDKFRRFGIRRVSIDEVARDLQISKKTIYQHFASKEDLVRDCLEERVVQRVLPIVARLLQERTPVAQRLGRLWQALSRVPALITPELIADVRSDYPAIWDDIDARRRKVLAGVESLLRDGIAEGEVRPEIHPRVAVRALLAIAERVLVPDVLTLGEFTPAEAFTTVSTLLTRGALLHPPDQPMPSPPKGTESP